MGHRSLAALAAVLSALSGGCSLIWTPAIDDVDASHGDAGVADAWVASDTGISRPELCANGLDDDGDDLVDCRDPDCFGAADCCSDTEGRALVGPFTVSGYEADWDHAIDLYVASEAGGAVLDFGSRYGWLRRRACAPLATGATFSLELARRTVPGDLSLVLSPARSPGATGFLDELAVRFDRDGLFSVTRAGTPIPLATPSGACSNVARSGDPRRYILAAPERLVVELRPATSNGRAILSARIRVSGSFDGGCTAVVPVDGLALDVQDLVRTHDGNPDSCSESPGLYVALEGEGAGFRVDAVTARTYECASPSIFGTDALRVLQREDLNADGVAPGFAVGGVGAPSLDFGGDVYRWRLLFDGSLEDRSAEIFRPLTTRIGLSVSPNLSAWSMSPESPGGGPVGGVGDVDVREPSGLYAGSDEIAFVRRADAGFDLYRARTLGSTGGTFDNVTQRLVASASGCSYREPALARADGANLWVFFRCDHGSSSTLGLAHDTENASEAPQIFSEDLLAPFPDIHDRVRAIDVLTRAKNDVRYFAVWVLVDAPSGGQALYLFGGEADDAGVTPPELHAYAGNPVLTSRDLALDCAESDCAITSFTVGQEPRTGPDRLVFYFARSRASSSGVTYEFVPRTQFAPRALDDGR